MADYDEIARSLEQRLKELTGRSGKIEDDLRHPLEADSSEQAIDLADDETLAGIDEVIQQEVRQIRAALMRIEEGVYGTCSACGRKIGVRRLQALPAATRCVNCA